MYKGLNVNVEVAKLALEIAEGDRKAAYSAYISLFFEQTRKFDCGCDNKDLQKFYDEYYGKNK